MLSDLALQLLDFGLVLTRQNSLVEHLDSVVDRLLEILR